MKSQLTQRSWSSRTLNKWKTPTYLATTFRSDHETLDLPPHKTKRKAQATKHPLQRPHTQSIPGSNPGQLTGAPFREVQKLTGVAHMTTKRNSQIGVEVERPGNLRGNSMFGLTTKHLIKHLLKAPSPCKSALHI